ncbi:MAG: DUF3526 domain-containing protein [Bacteroidota bacterium]
MYRLLFQQFLRTRASQFGLILILVLGGISIIIGKQFLINQREEVDQAAKMQKEHLERNVELHGDDLPLLLYYSSFTLLNETNPLAGLSIGQKDLNPHVKRIGILAVEGQKYDSDLVNPTKLLFGNLDLSFVIVYLLPLLVIAFTYNLLSEEMESGTWYMVNVMAKSKLSYLIAKLSVRFLLLAVILLLLIAVGGTTLGIPWNTSFQLFIATSLLYLIFWFVLSFWIACLKQNSNFNALTLLSIWLVLLVLLPAFINNQVTNKYPLPEALSLMIKQRDGYHTKWDTNKRKTMEAFYKDYPQFEEYGFPPEQGYNHPWYYAMQHLGDAESREESRAMLEKVQMREASSRRWAQLVPTLHTQLVFNSLAGTGLTDYISFLEYTNEFHEKIKLIFYPHIFSGATADALDWEQFTPKTYTNIGKSFDRIKTLIPMISSILLFVVLSAVSIRKVI